MKLILLVLIFALIGIASGSELEERYIVYSCQNFEGIKVAEFGKGYFITYDKNATFKCVAEKDGIIRAAFIPNDEHFGKQWYLKSIAVPEAWNLTTGDSEIVVAVVDSGASFTHEDLRGIFWINEDEVPNNGIDDDGNGYVDDYYGYDFVNNDGNPEDDNGHGTMMVGILAAKLNNEIGIAGVARVKVMVLKVLDENGFGYESDLAEAIMYAVDNGARIISMSLGGTEYNSLLESACSYAWRNDVLLVAAAGNSGVRGVEYPAKFDTVVAVGSVDESDKRSTFSNYGEVEIVAPGEDVFTTNIGNSYSYVSGTSASTPQVAGVAALILSVNPELSSADLRRLLKETADDLGYPGKDAFYGYGKVNATRVLRSVELLKKSWGMTNSMNATVSIDSPVVRGDGILRVVWKGNGTLKVVNSLFNEVDSVELLREGEIYYVLRNLPAGGYKAIVYDEHGKTVTKLFFLVDDKKPDFAVNYSVKSVEIFENETFEARICVKNLGYGGYFVLEFKVDRKLLNISKFFVESQDLVCLNLSHSFTEVGEHLVELNDFSINVTVLPRKVYEVSLNVSKKTISVGENLTVSVCVKNNLWKTIERTLNLSVNGEVSRILNFTVLPNETSCVEEFFSFESPGNYTLLVDNSSAIVQVIGTFKPVIFATVTPLNGSAPLSVKLKLSVENRGNVEGLFRLTIKVNGGVVKTLGIFLDPGETVNLTTNYTLVKPGFYDIFVNDVIIATVNVTAPPMPGDADNDGWNDTVEELIAYYNPDFDPADVPTADDVINAVVGAVSKYFAPETTDEEKEQIVSDVITLVQEYFKYF